MASQRLAAILLLVAALLVAAQGQDLDTCVRGRSTFYNYNTVGACGFSTYAGDYTVAPNEAFFNGAASCGECFEVTGPKGSHIYMVADECPVNGNVLMCSGDITHFDMNQNTFSTIGDSGWGVTNMQYRRVVCPTSDGVAAIIGWGSGAYSDYYLQTHIFNHKVGITGVKVADATMSSWDTLTRTDYNAWNWNSGHVIVYPVVYAVTSRYGETINVTMGSKPTALGQKFSGSTQFTVFTAVPGTDVCPTLYEFNIYVNALNDGSPQNPAQYWGATDADNWAYTGTLPSGATAAARKTLSGYSEWGFWTKSSTATIPLSLITGVQFQVLVPAGTSALQIMWGEYSDGHIVTLPSIAANTWYPVQLNVSDFGTSLPDLGKLAFKNSASTALTDLTIANFQVNRVAGQADPPLAPISSTPTQPPTPPTSSGSSPSAPSTGSSNPTDSVTTPTNGPSSVATGNAAHTLYALVSILALALLVNV